MSKSNETEKKVQRQIYPPPVYRVVRFTAEKSWEPSSHVEFYDEENREWVRVTLHMPDAEADLIGLRLNTHAELLAALERIMNAVNHGTVRMRPELGIQASAAIARAKGESK